MAQLCTQWTVCTLLLSDSVGAVNELSGGRCRPEQPLTPASINPTSTEVAHTTFTGASELAGMVGGCSYSWYTEVMGDGKELRNTWNQLLWYAEEAPEAQRCHVSCLRSCSWLEAEATVPGQLFHVISTPTIPHRPADKISGFLRPSLKKRKWRK